MPEQNDDQTPQAPQTPTPETSTSLTVPHEGEEWKFDLEIRGQTPKIRAVAFSSKGPSIVVSEEFPTVEEAIEDVKKRIEEVLKLYDRD